MTTDRDREAFEAWKAERCWPANPTDELMATHCAQSAWHAALSHARAQAGEPVAWQHRYVFRGASEMPWRDGRAPTSSPFAPEDECYSDYKVEERALYTHPAPAQEPVAVPAGEPIRSAKGEGIPEVIYVSSPVIKWPNAVLSGTWESRPDERCSVRFAAAVSPPADRPQQFMSDKTRQFVEPVRKMLAEGINVQALGEATNQIIEGAFRSLVGHIDELEMDLAALRTAVALASTPAPQPGGAVKVKALENALRAFITIAEAEHWEDGHPFRAAALHHGTEALKMTAGSPQPEDFAKGAEAMREACAKAVEPAGERPCDCERCDCRNRDDAERVAHWDEAKDAADIIRALPLPTPAGEG